MSAAATPLSRPAVPLNPLDPDEWTLPHDSPVITSLRFLQWTVQAAGVVATVITSEVQGGVSPLAPLTY